LKSVRQRKNSFADLARPGQQQDSVKSREQYEGKFLSGKDAKEVKHDWEIAGVLVEAWD
jgi:hypothetical protein